jgi:hypothetical protein
MTYNSLLGSLILFVLSKRQFRKRRKFVMEGTGFVKINVGFSGQMCCDKWALAEKTGILLSF